jgi:nucleoside-diphosphate-sugar epimerase
MPSALIGHTGFVGTTLLKQHSFDELYRSTNIWSIRGRSFDTVICAGAPAQKWIANREPEADRKNIESLIACLGEVKCKHLVLISTVDVFKQPVGVDESTPVDEVGLHPYGLHRRMLERFVETLNTATLVVRLPGLVGPGLRKNVIYDLLNDNNVQAADSRSVFQFYPMVNLKHDIDTAWRENLKLVHLTGAPVSVAEIAEDGFNKLFD